MHSSICSLRNPSTCLVWTLSHNCTEAFGRDVIIINEEVSSSPLRSRSNHDCPSNGEMKGHQSCKSYVYYVSEIPLHDFCCA